MIRMLMRLVNRSPSKLSISPETRARSSPPTTVPISSATSIQSCLVAPPDRARVTTSSMISFATHSVTTGTIERTMRRTIIAAVYAGCVSQTKRTRRGTSRIAAIRSLRGGRGARGSRRDRGATTRGGVIARNVSLCVASLLVSQRTERQSAAHVRRRFTSANEGEAVENDYDGIRPGRGITSGSTRP